MAATVTEWPASRSQLPSKEARISLRYAGLRPSVSPIRHTPASVSSAYQLSSRARHQASRSMLARTASVTRKPGGSPASRGAPVSSRAAKPCSVVIAASSNCSSATAQRARPCAVWPGSALAASSASRIRVRSSVAAFSVNVIAARPLTDFRQPQATMDTTRSTSCLVFPLPAPASTNRFASCAATIRSRAPWSSNPAVIRCRRPAQRGRRTGSPAGHRGSAPTGRHAPLLHTRSNGHHEQLSNDR